MEPFNERSASTMSETAQNASSERKASPTENERPTSESFPWVPILLQQLPRSRSHLNVVSPISYMREPKGVFDAEELKIIVAAYAEACSFFADRLSQTQRNSVASAILSHARRGLIDLHRLAIKGIVAL